MVPREQTATNYSTQPRKSVESTHETGCMPHGPRRGVAARDATGRERPLIIRKRPGWIQVTDPRCTGAAHEARRRRKSARTYKKCAQRAGGPQRFMRYLTCCHSMETGAAEQPMDSFIFRGRKYTALRFCAGAPCCMRGPTKKEGERGESCA